MKNKKQSTPRNNEKNKLLRVAIIKDELQPFYPCISNKASSNKTKVKTIRG